VLKGVFELSGELSGDNSSVFNERELLKSSRIFEDFNELIICWEFVGRDEVVFGIRRGGSGRDVGRDVVVFGRDSGRYNGDSGRDVEEREGEREKEEGKDSGLIGL